MDRPLCLHDYLFIVWLLFCTGGLLISLYHTPSSGLPELCTKLLDRKQHMITLTLFISTLMGKLNDPSHSWRWHWNVASGLPGEGL